MASKLSNNHPIIVGRINDDGILQGSYRSPIDIHIQSAHDTNNKPYILTKQGHTGASGITLYSYNIPYLVEYYNNIQLPLPHELVLKTYTYNDLINANNKHIIKLCQQYEHSFNLYPNIYGKGLSAPYICIKSIPYKPTYLTVFKNGHTVKYDMSGLYNNGNTSDNNDINISLMFLWLPNDKIDKLTNINESDESDESDDLVIDIIAMPSISYYGGMTYQFKVQDFVIRHENPFC